MAKGRPPLEPRIAELERKVAELQEQIRDLQPGSLKFPPMPYQSQFAKWPDHR
jgi:hypothetical protein